MDSLQNFSFSNTPQQVKASEKQVQNSAGGFTFEKLDCVVSSFLVSKVALFTQMQDTLRSTMFKSSSVWRSTTQ